MKTRFNQSGSAAYSPNVQRPEKKKAVSNRGIWGLILSILLPPVGLTFLWRKGVFRTRGRMLITAIATIEMMVVFALAMPKETIDTHLPAPIVPAAVTKAPETDTLTALSNIEQLLYEKQLAEVKAQGGSEADLMTDEQLAQIRQEEEEILKNTIVYSVYNGAIKYHAKKICGTQTNGRELTVEQAMSEGLAVCPNCNPPVWTG
ncbi:MAG: hypothetical protein IKM02_06320 [Clostridia bacterium]|nr:hypothetical protein [Clostridia bacterium]